MARDHLVIDLQMSSPMAFFSFKLLLLPHQFHLLHLVVNLLLLPVQCLLTLEKPSLQFLSQAGFH